MSLCPNCSCSLEDKENIIATEESKLFKGNNIYIMCKKCGYVMVYNRSRKLVYSLDNYKDDKEVMEEVATLLTEATQNEVELVEVKEETPKVTERLQQKKTEPESEQESENEVVPDVEEHNCSGDCSHCSGCINQEVILLAFNKQTQEFELVKESALEKLEDLSIYDFYLLERVLVERTVQHKIHKL